MIIGLLRKIERHLAEIVRLLRTPEDFTHEDQAVLDATKQIHEAKERLPHQDKQPTGD